MSGVHGRCLINLSEISSKERRYCCRSGTHGPLESVQDFLIFVGQVRGLEFFTGLGPVSDLKFFIGPGPVRDLYFSAGPGPIGFGPPIPDVDGIVLVNIFLVQVLVSFL